MIKPYFLTEATIILTAHSILFTDVPLAPMLITQKCNSNMYVPWEHFLYQGNPMGNPNQEHKNQLRVCLYFAFQNLVGTGSLLTSYTTLESILFSSPSLIFCFLFHVGLFQWPHLLASLLCLTPSTRSSAVNRLFPSTNTGRTVTFKIIQCLSIAFRISFQPTIHLFIHSTSI